MLRLAEQVCGDHVCTRAVVGNDHELARTGRHVDRRSSGDAGHQTLGLGNPCVSATTDLVDLADLPRTERKRCDRLGSANSPDALDAADLCCECDHRIETAL